MACARSAFSAEEAERFLQDIGVSEVHGNRLKLLNDIVFKLAGMPFQNVSMLATKPDERQPLSLQQAVVAMTQGYSGLCFTKHVFAKQLLEALGFEISMLAASVTRPGNHVLLLARCVVHMGDRYLVEVGCGYPSFAAVPLNFDDDDDFESEHYKESYLEFRYLKRKGERLVIRQHREGDPCRPIVNDSLGRHGETPEGWRRFYDFFLDQTNAMEVLATGLFEICHVYEQSPFLQSLRLVRWTHAKMVAVKNDVLIVEEDTGKLERHALADASAMRGAILQHFPEIPMQSVDVALDYWVEHIRSKSM